MTWYHQWLLSADSSHPACVLDDGSCKVLQIPTMETFSSIITMSVQRHWRFCSVDSRCSQQDAQRSMIGNGICCRDVMDIITVELIAGELYLFGNVVQVEMLLRKRVYSCLFSWTWTFRILQCCVLCIFNLSYKSVIEITFIPNCAAHHGGKVCKLCNWILGAVLAAEIFINAFSSGSIVQGFFLT